MSIQELFAQLTAPQVLGQLLVILIAVLGAVTTGHYLRGWWSARKVAFDGQPWQLRIANAATIIAPIALALLLILLARAIFAAFSQPTASLDLALQLVTAMLLVRLGMHALRLLLGEFSWLRGYETKLTVAIWLVIAFHIAGWFKAVENLLDSIDLLPGNSSFTLWDLMRGLFTVTAFVLITSLVARAIERRVMKINRVAMSTRIGISKSAHVVLVSLGVMLGIRASGVDLSVLTVFTGAIGLGLGFGLQAIASNFVSGFVLLMDRSIKPGDVISFTGHTGTSTENFGWVQELRGRYVVVRDRDGVDTLVPNQHLITNPVINWSYSDRRVRLKLPVRISYRDDPEVALKVLLDAASGNARILHEPAPVSRLMQFGDNGMDLELRFWISDPENGVNNVRSEVNRAIWQLFKQHNVTIPVTQREVHVLGPDQLTRQ